MNDPISIHLSADCVKGATVEQLNHLAAIIEDYNDKKIAKLNAVIGIMPDPECIDSIIGHAHNISAYDHHPDIQNHVQLGEYCLNKSGLVQMPEEWAAAVDLEKLGQIVAEDEKGIFTEQGYIVENGIAWEPVPKIPKDYQIAERGKGVAMTGSLSIKDRIAAARAEIAARNSAHKKEGAQNKDAGLGD